MTFAGTETVNPLTRLILCGKFLLQGLACHYQQMGNTGDPCHIHSIRSHSATLFGFHILVVSFLLCNAMFCFLLLCQLTGFLCPTLLSYPYIYPLLVPNSL